VRRRARTDRNHAEIRDGLRAAGCTVKDLSFAGEGFPDLLVWSRRVGVRLMEVKRPGGKLTEKESQFAISFLDCYVVVHNLDEALRAMGYRAIDER
jgi:hypothetical protein